MSETNNTAKSVDNVWSFGENILQHNKATKNATLDIPKEDVVSENIDGYIINSIGSVVAKFGFFVYKEDEKIQTVVVHHDGFMGKMYRSPVQVIIGYGKSPFLPALLDLQTSQMIVISPDKAEDGEFLFDLEKDELLKNQGVMVVMRDVDVEVDLLNDSIKQDFIDAKNEASVETSDLNEIEQSFNNYIRVVYSLLSEEITT